MKTILKLTALSAFLLMMAGGLASCRDKEEPFLMVDETPISVIAEGGIYHVVVNSNGAWTAVVEGAENHEWCVLTISNDTIFVNIDKNLSLEERQATIKISLGRITKSVVVNQKTASILYPIEPHDDIIAFFRRYLPSTVCPKDPIRPMPSECFFVGDFNMMPVIINSYDEFRHAFSCCSSIALPTIDFDTYTLIIGQHIMPLYTWYIIGEQNIIVGTESIVLNLTVYRSGSGYTIPTIIYYWGIYRKIPNMPISVNATFQIKWP